MKYDKYSVIHLILCIIFGQILVFGGMGPIEKPWYFLGALVTLMLVDIVSTIRR